MPNAPRTPPIAQTRRSLPVGNGFAEDDRDAATHISEAGRLGDEDDAVDGHAPAGRSPPPKSPAPQATAAASPKTDGRGPRREPVDQAVAPSRVSTGRERRIVDAVVDGGRPGQLDDGVRPRRRIGPTSSGR